jgi:hypothetical protein
MGWYPMADMARSLLIPYVVAIIWIAAFVRLTFDLKIARWAHSESEKYFRMVSEIGDREVSGGINSS